MDVGRLKNEENLIRKFQELEEENARLKKILEEHGISYSVTDTTTTRSLQTESPLRLNLQEKVALFKSVFSRP